MLNLAVHILRMRGLLCSLSQICLHHSPRHGGSDCSLRRGRVKSPGGAGICVRRVSQQVYEWRYTATIHIAQLMQLCVLHSALGSADSHLVCLDEEVRPAVLARMLDMVALVAAPDAVNEAC